MDDFILFFSSFRRIFRLFPATCSSTCPSTLQPDQSQSLLLLPSAPSPPPSPAHQDSPRNPSGPKGTSLWTSITVPPPPPPPSPTLSPSSAPRSRRSRPGATAPCPRAPASTVSRSGMSGAPSLRTYGASLRTVGQRIPSYLPTATLCVQRKSPHLLCSAAPPPPPCPLTPSAAASPCASPSVPHLCRCAPTLY